MRTLKNCVFLKSIITIIWEKAESLIRPKVASYSLVDLGWSVCDIGNRPLQNDLLNVALLLRERATICEIDHVTSPNSL